MSRWIMGAEGETLSRELWVGPGGSRGSTPSQERPSPRLKARMPGVRADLFCRRGGWRTGGTEGLWSLILPSGPAAQVQAGPWRDGKFPSLRRNSRL